MINIYQGRTNWIPETVAKSANEKRGFTIARWRYVGPFPGLRLLVLSLFKI